ncbi:hypothetical protein KEJ49_07140 [Candidatus Bathyarchaeota archaeon]|nr:hypothetical protein [Candidatus Bathyarchaeota archaeon]
MRIMGRSSSPRPTDGTRLIILPRRMIEGLKEAAERAGISLSGFASWALEEAIRAERMGIPLGEAVELYDLFRVQRDAGAVQVSRSILEYLVSRLYDTSGEELRRLWHEEGRWYGEYLKARLRGEGVLEFLERALKASWNLETAEVRVEDGFVRVRCASFNMSIENTELLISYISGLMNALGFEEADRDYLNGLAILLYRRMPLARLAPREELTGKNKT